jgi:hypothetical protein
MVEEARDGQYYSILGKDAIVKQWVFLLYGAAGNEKTRTAAQFPKPMFLSCERGTYGGLVSAKEFNPMQIKVKGYEHLLGLLPTLEKDAGTVFKTIVLDSFTQFQKMILASVLTSANREMPQQQDWGLVQSRCRTILNRLGDMNCHVVFITTEAYTQDAMERMFGVPNVAGKFAAELPAGVDICLRMTSQTEVNAQGQKVVKRIMQSKPDSIWTCQKDCSGTLPGFMHTSEGEYTFSHLKHLFEDDTLNKKEG